MPAALVARSGLSGGQRAGHHQRLWYRAGLPPPEGSAASDIRYRSIIWRRGSTWHFQPTPSGARVRVLPLSTGPLS
ncbi:hypothetical protein RRG08_036484 [Elysia crispata]|uniref:Uncharacterized protein n=1 Tax=Elysia crispata TaxID=231223 RepID=A0AAE0ZK87_9GAST|nr:hypothetical protein RRG08_036484 [Elysia crispata]